MKMHLPRIMANEATLADKANIARERRKREQVAKQTILKSKQQQES